MTLIDSTTRHFNSTGPHLPDPDLVHSRKRHLFIDVSVISREDAGTGIQRVVRALWSELTGHIWQNVMICPVAATRDRGYVIVSNDFLDRTAPADGNSHSAIDPRAGDLFLGLDLAAHLLPRHDRQIARFKALGLSVHIIVYDMLPYLHPQWFRLRARYNFRRWLRFLDRHADQLICISQSVAADVDRWIYRRRLLPGRNIAVSTIRLGSDIAGSMPSKGLPSGIDELRAWMTAGPCIITVGTIEPRKGHDRILAAFEHLWSGRATMPVRLLVVGRPGWNTAKLQARIKAHSEYGARLRWIDDASDELLERIYACAGGVMFASHGEGLGLPLLEAAAHSKPVLVRDLPVYRELGLANVRWFTDDYAQALAETILSWIGDWSDHAPKPQTLPSWQNSADDLIARLGLSSERISRSLSAGTEGETD
ncbi:glycosyltransferase family 4 protein [Sphingobium xanthum]|uniref:glycosyltransferase family 4 protein n=1 Tax=Sphingobium xanthum TaxID=1387165 RepID=UPI001C8C7998|nr:glycosyltransferase family 1 protein [Sphingobium xanthum]